MAFLDPTALLIFFGALALAYGVGRFARALYRRWKRPTAPAPTTRAERRRAERGRR